MGMTDQPQYRVVADRECGIEGRRKDGSLFPFDLAVAEGEGGLQASFTGIMRYVSGSRDSAAALRASEERLRLLQNEFAHLARVNDLSEMAAAIAHEINQPLAAIANYLNGGLLMVDRESPAEALAAARSAMTFAAEQGLRAGAIVRAAQEFVRKGEGLRRVARADALVDSALALALIDRSGAGVEVERRTAGPGALVEVDAVQIQQMLVNLIRNALEAMAVDAPGQARKLSIATHDLPGQGVVEYCVADNGPGIAPALRGRLFEPFVTSKAMGLGMGLSICRRIVEAHEGSIAADDREGSGATFRIRLPRSGN